VVRADVVRDPGECLVWRRPDGKALIVAVALAGVHYYISAAHYPAADGDDEARAEFETEMRCGFEQGRAVHEAVHPAWKGASLPGHAAALTAGRPGLVPLTEQPAW